MRTVKVVLLGLVAGLAFGTGALRLAYSDGNAGWDDCDAQIHCASIVEQPPGSGTFVCTSTPQNGGCAGACSPCDPVGSSSQCPSGYRTCQCHENPDNDPSDYGWDDCITCLQVNGLNVVTNYSCSAWFCPPTSECELVWDTSTNKGACECIAPGGP